MRIPRKTAIPRKPRKHKTEPKSPADIAYFYYVKKSKSTRINPYILALIVLLFYAHSSVI